MPKPTLTLTINDSTVSNVGGVPVRTIELQVSGAANGLPTNDLFVIRKVSGNDEFVTVASVADLTNFPDNANDATAEQPYYRTSTVTMSTDFPHIADEFLTNIQRRLKALVDALDQLDENQTNTSYTITAT